MQIHLSVLLYFPALFKINKWQMEKINMLTLTSNNAIKARTEKSWGGPREVPLQPGLNAYWKYTG